MRKTYQMILALALLMLGATNAMGQKIYRTDVDKSMFKAWTSEQPGAQEVADPQPIDVSDENPNGTAFSCDYNLYKELGDWSGIFGSSAAYYLWYADLTGTTKMYFKGSVGFKFWVQFNRQAPEEGGDAHGGAMVQQELTIGADGTAVYEIPADMTYVHLNCIKTKGSGVRGTLNAIEIEGTVKPVTGILSMINNGDAEGTDLSSFPVSWDGPNNGGTANEVPEIVDGGVNGSKCFKVVSYPNPTETWHTQFYVKSDEVLAKGTKWKLVMSVKADHETKITTSAQAEPRAWKGSMGINEFKVTEEWKEYTWEGEIGVDGFQSIAFDLNNGDERNADDTGWAPGNGGCGFFFDNIQFGVDLGGSNPMSDVKLAYGVDVICVNLNNNTNLVDLVKAKGMDVTMPDEAGNMVRTKSLPFDDNCATVTWNGKTCSIASIEGRLDGNLYIFIADMDGEGGTDFEDENAEVKVAFTNPADADHHLTFSNGKWAGQAVPDFSGQVCEYDYSLGEGQFYSYLYGAPEAAKVEPENGSFNLPADLKEFKITFNQRVETATVVAKLEKEALTVSPAEGLAKEITLTRTGSSDLSGVKTLTISEAVGEKGMSISENGEPIIMKYSFGQTQIGGDDQPEVIYQSDFASADNGGTEGAGWQVNADAGGLQPANSGAGCRLMHGQGAFLDDLLYVAQRGTPASQGGVALYGLLDDYKLALQAGKNYHLTFGACKHDRDNVALTVQVLPEAAVNTEDGTILDESQIIVSDRQEITPAKTSKEAVRFDLAIPVVEDGNYVLRFVPSKSDGTPGGFDGCVCFADVKVEYIPDVMGLVEMRALAETLENAKATRENNSEERFNGPAYTALDNVINEYDGKVMTAPSAYEKAQDELKAAVEAMSAHRKLCDEYDALPNQLFDVWYANKDTKFNTTELFAKLKPMLDKYGTVVTTTTEDGTTIDELESFLILKDDAELTAAKTELSELIDMAKKMFTTGQSHNLYGGGDRTTGYAALHERLRRGVALLESLGYPEDTYEIRSANAELGDNDEIAEAIMNRASAIILGDFVNGTNQLFAVDEETGEPATYDLSVFAKNPNIYSPANSTDLPGWTAARGTVTVFPGWGAEHTTQTAYAEDCQIHAGWHPSNLPMVEQTIEKLPAGIYSINIDGSDNNSPVSDGTYGYVKVTGTPEYNDGDELDPEVHFAGYVHCSGLIEGIEVLDGKLTVGFSYGAGSQAFINDITITMTAPIAGHDYSAAYKEVIDGIDGTVAKPAKALRIELFDLNGRRVAKAQKGLTIVKKVMSDGSVKTEKVIVK